MNIQKHQIMREVQEIRLARKLAREIQYVIDGGGVLPVQVLNAYKPLKRFYDDRIWEEYEEYRGK
tara:strand:+ start:275 stop:469 length:195 start_codon:yes stop_codon:yes gene_type:complete